MAYIADTHALLWYMSDDSRLGKEANKIFDECERGRIQVIIPTIVLLECLDVIEKKKVGLDIHNFLADIMESSNFEVVPLDIGVLLEVIKTTNDLDLHDRSIVATAKFRDAHILTKDRMIQRVYQKTIW